MPPRTTYTLLASNTKAHNRLAGSPAFVPRQHQQSMICCAGSTPQPKAEQQQCVDRCSKSLATADDLQQKYVNAATHRARGTAASELADGKHSMRAANCQSCSARTMLTVGSEDNTVFSTQHWLPLHASFVAVEVTAASGPEGLPAIDSNF